MPTNLEESPPPNLIVTIGAKGLDGRLLIVFQIARWIKRMVPPSRSLTVSGFLTCHTIKLLGGHL